MLETTILCVTSGKRICVGVPEFAGAATFPLAYGAPDTWYEPTLPKPTP
jgi:hypothetical protein